MSDIDLLEKNKEFFDDLLFYLPENELLPSKDDKEKENQPKIKNSEMKENTEQKGQKHIKQFPQGKKKTDIIKSSIRPGFEGPRYKISKKD